MYRRRSCLLGNVPVVALAALPFLLLVAMGPCQVAAGGGSASSSTYAKPDQCLNDAECLLCGGAQMQQQITTCSAPSITTQGGNTISCCDLIKTPAQSLTTITGAQMQQCASCFASTNSSLQGDLDGAANVCFMAELCGSQRCTNPKLPIHLDSSRDQSKLTCDKFGADTGVCCDPTTNEQLAELMEETRSSLAGTFNRCSSCAKSIERIQCALACSPKQGTILRHSPTNPGSYQLMLSERLVTSLWQSCSGDDYTTPPKETGKPAISTGFRVQYSTGSTMDRAKKFFTEEKPYFRLYVPGVEQRVEIVITSNESLGLTEEDMGKNDHGKTYHVYEYCDVGYDTIMETSVQILARVILLVSGALIGNKLHQKHITSIPESGIFIILGMLFGAFYLLVRGQSAANDLRFDADFLTLVLLPPIIFYSGYCMPNIGNFIANIREIMILAGAGTMASTLFVGYGLYYVRNIGGHSEFQNINIWECLSFAALISAVDPVATLATFSALKVDPNLEVLVFGEALLNDAVAIVLYKSFAKFTKYGGPSEHFGYADAALKFVALTLGSLAVGIVSGAVEALVFKFVFFKHTEVLEIITFLSLAYSSFLIAEYFHFSGIIASLVHGMMAAGFVKQNMSAAGHQRSFILTNTIASLADMMIFVMTGVVAVVGVVNDISWSFTGFTLIFILVARAVAVFPLVAIVNICRSKQRRITIAHSVSMWWAGLRGAIAVGLVVGIPTSLRYMMLATTVVIVLLTVFVMGGTTALMLKKLGVKMGDDAPEIYSKPSQSLLKFSVRLQKILCNYDEDGDGIDDRYQSVEYIKRSETMEVTAQGQESKSEAGAVAVPHEKRKPWSDKVTTKDSIKSWQPVDEDDEQNLNLKQLSNMKNWDGDVAAPDASSRTKVLPVDTSTSATY